MKPGLVVAIVCAVNLFAASAATEAQLRERREALKNLEKDLFLQRKQLQTLISEEKGVLNTLSLLEQNLNGTRVYLEELNRLEMALMLVQEQTQREVDSLALDCRRQSEAMVGRIRELYIAGCRSEWEQLLAILHNKENPDRQWVEVRYILEDDRRRIERLESALQLLETRRRELKAKAEELQVLRQRKAREEQTLREQVGRQQIALETLRRDREMQQRALEEFERNQKALMALIQALEEKKRREEAEARRQKKKVVRNKDKTAKATSKFLQATGPKCVPMQGRLLSEYGLHEHELLHTVTRNLGVEIQAERGAAVRAAAAGTVVLVSRIQGRGPSVILDHGNSYYSVYGHMQKIDVKVGQEVRHCQVLGEAGDIESTNGPKLFFQVSEGTRTVNPMEWLKQ